VTLTTGPHLLHRCWGEARQDRLILTLPVTLNHQKLLCGEGYYAVEVPWVVNRGDENAQSGRPLDYVGLVHRLTETLMPAPPSHPQPRPGAPYPLFLCRLGKQSPGQRHYPA